MLTIELKDGTELECIDVFGSKKHVQGNHRDVFEFHFSTDGNSFDALNQLFSDASKTEEITIIETKTVEGEEGPEEFTQEFLHKNFNLHVSTEIRPVEIAKETSETPAMYEDRFIVTLGQLTYTEHKIAQQERDIAQLYFMMMLGGGAND